MQYIGCHLTISKGFSAMGRQAVELGANTAQFFTRNPRGGKAKDIDPADIQGLRDTMAQHGFGRSLYHQSLCPKAGDAGICPDHHGR